MKITNKLQFPKEIYDKIVKHNAHPITSDYSVTQVIDSPKRVRLAKRHDENIEVDCSDLWPAFIGQMLHRSFEDNITLTVGCLGKTVSGTLDRIKDGIITDYKTGMYASLFNFSHPEWEEQLNLYAFLAKSVGLKVIKLVIQPLAYDWRDNYKTGLSPVEPMIIPLWEFDMQEQFLIERVKLHKAVEAEFDNLLPDCTPQEMWESNPTYACLQPKRVRAERVLPSFEEADKWVEENQYRFKKLTIIERPGKRIRCEKYCNVSAFCKQWKDFNEKVG